MKKFRESTASILFILGILIAIGMWDDSKGLAITTGIIFFAIGGWVLPPDKCELCSAKIKRKYFKWKIEGKNKYVCPSCNSALNRKRSNKAVSDIEI